MPTATAPDGVKLDWGEGGRGAPVLVTTQAFADRAVSSALVDDLARDHRVVVYDPRGTGESSRRGPYDIETDVSDLICILEQAEATPAVVVGIANCCEQSVLVASRHPELAAGVVVPAGNPAGLRAARRSEALAGSDSVLSVLEGMIAADYRAALWTILTSGNPGIDEDELRRRIDRQMEYCPAEAAAGRLSAWLQVDCLEEARSLGRRLHVLVSGTQTWFAGAEPTREALPEAIVEEVPEGHITRPEFCASAVRRMSKGNP